MSHRAEVAKALQAKAEIVDMPGNKLLTSFQFKSDQFDVGLTVHVTMFQIIFGDTT